MADNLLRKTLFICDLDNSITEPQLQQAFEEEKYKVASVRINKSKHQGGRNTAFVNFETEEDAKKALESLNHLTLGNCEMYLTYASKGVRGDSNNFYPSNTTVFVKNVPKEIDTVILIKIFSSMFGEVSNLRIMRDEKGESRGYGYITFKNEEDAKKAIGHAQEMKFEINGKQYTFNFEFSDYVAKQTRGDNWTNTYIRYYTDAWNREKLEGFVRGFGALKSFVPEYIEDLSSVDCKCDFVNHEDAKKFLQFHGKKLYEDTMTPVNGEPEPGRPVITPYIRRYMTHNERLEQCEKLKREGCGISISGFSISKISVRDINEEFGKIGSIFSTLVYERPDTNVFPKIYTGFPRAIILFDNNESAQNAIKLNKITSINGKPTYKPLEVEFYNPRSYMRNNNRNKGMQNKHHPRGNNINDVNTRDFFDGRQRGYQQHNQGQMQNQAMNNNNNNNNNSNDNNVDIETQLENSIKEYLTKKNAEELPNLKNYVQLFHGTLTDDDIIKAIQNPEQFDQYMLTFMAQ